MRRILFVIIALFIIFISYNVRDDREKSKKENNQVEKKKEQVTPSWIEITEYPSLQEAINDAKEKGKNVYLNERIIYVSSDIIIPSNVKVFGGTIKFLNQSSIILKGNKPSMYNVTIDSQVYGIRTRGIIELVNTEGANLKSIKILGDNDATAILCKTRAKTTYIEDIDISGKIAWGLLFNDAESEQGKGYRTVQGIDYSVEGLGSGLYIDNFKFGNVKSTRNGDGIEINAPDYGFDDIVIKDVLVRKANRANDASSNGIGLGFANCMNVKLEDLKVYNTGHDAIHFEKGKNHLIKNFYVKNSYRTIGISHTEHSLFQKGLSFDSDIWIASYNRLSQKPLENVTFEDITFDGAKEYGILLSNAKNINFKKITLKNYNGSATTPIIQFYDAGKGSVFNSKLTEIKIIKANGRLMSSSIIGILKGSINNRLSNIVFDGYDIHSISVDKSLNQLNELNESNGTK